VIGLDRPFSDDFQVNISSSSSRDEGHLNLLATESEVGTRSSEFKVPQVQQVVVMGLSDLQSAPPVGTVDSEVTFKPSTIQARYFRLLPIFRSRRPTPLQARSTCPHDRKKRLEVDSSHVRVKTVTFTLSEPIVYLCMKSVVKHYYYYYYYYY